MSPARLLLTLALAGPATTALSGCTYDYLQHTDTVSYHAGDAVQANLEAETINPARPSIFSTSGLGRNGKVIPAANATASSAAGATPAPTGASAATGTAAQVN